MDVSDEPLALQADLSCPICRGIYRDPVMLDCTHSFCRECLKNSYKVSHKCPVCRVAFSEQRVIPNRALSGACESFLKQGNMWTRQTTPKDGLCNLHLKPLELYCQKDEEPVCVDCVTLHSQHRLMSLQDGVPLCKNELSYKVQIFEKKVESYEKMTKKFSNAVEYVKSQAQQAEEQIKKEFERLHDMLNKEEKLRLKALADEEDQKITALSELNKQTERDIAALKELIDTIKREMGNEDLFLLKNFQNLKRKTEWTRAEPCLSQDSLINMAAHVGGLSYNIWKNMEAHVKYYPVVLNPNTASPQLLLNADLTCMKESVERMTTPENLERFDPCVFVLGAEGYTSGKHKWDVIVGDNPKWVLGVCNESVARKKKFTISPSRGVWSISLSKGVYSVFTQERTELQLQESPEKIRIKLDIDKGEVSFRDGETAKHLVTLTYKFDEKIFPFFGPGVHANPMTLAPGKIAVHTS